MARPIDIETLLTWAFRDERVETTRNPPENALTVYWAVMALPEPHGTLVRQYAREGAIPDWRASTGHIVSLDQSRRARTVYAQWLRALALLQHTLNGSLRGYSVYGPVAPAEPWRAGASVSYSAQQAL